MDFLDPDEIDKKLAPKKQQQVAQTRVSDDSFRDPDSLPQAHSGQSAMDELSDMSVGRQALSGAMGGPEATLSMASTIPAMVAGGLRGGYSLATGEGVTEATRKSQETTNRYTYEPRSAAGKVFVEGMGKGFEHLKETAGDIEEAKAHLINRATGHNLMNEAAQRTGGEAGFEAIAAASPFLGMKGRARPTAPIEAPVKPKFEFVDPDAQTVRNAPESDNLYNPQQTQLGTRPEGIKLGKDEVITDEGRRIPNAPEYDPGVGSRLREQEYFGPREAREPADNGIDYARYDPNRINDQVAAADKPGFQRSAEEVMRARELEKASSEMVGNRDRSSETLGARFAPQYDPAFYNEKLGKTLGDTGNVRDGLDLISKESKVPIYREIAQKLLEDKTYNPKFQITDEMQNSKNLGEFAGVPYEIRMKKGFENSEYIFLHENIHARTQAALSGRMPFGHFEGGLKHLKAPVDRIHDLFESLAGEGNKNGFQAYGLTNVHEFVAEGFTNPNFQAELAKRTLPKDLRHGGLKSYWDAFVEGLAKLFGFKRDTHNYLSELIRAGADLIDGANKQDRTYWSDKDQLSEVHGVESKLELEPIKKEIDKKQGKEGTGIMGAVMDRARDFSLDKRSFEQMYDAQLKDKKLQDFAPESQKLLGRIYNRLGAISTREFLQDTTIALLKKGAEGTGPLIKWVTDQVSQIDRKYLTQTKNAIDSGLKDFRRMFYSDKATLAKMRDVWMDNTGKRDLARTDFANEKQWNVYSAMQKVYNDILKSVNEMRTKAGYQPIERIPSYFHSAWEGDYRVFGYDAKGEKVWAFGYKTEVGAMKDVKKLQQQHPDIKWEQTEAKRNKYGLMDLSAFEEAMKVMGKDDPVTQAIQKTYQDILQHRGFGKTGIHKKGIAGFLGQSGSLRDMERSFVQYVEQAHRYMSNLEKQLVLRDLQKLPKEQRDQIPMTMDFLNSYIHKARGGRGLIDWETKTLDDLGSALGLGVNAPRNLVRGMGQIVYMYWLTTPRFLASQTVQSINALPKLVQEHGVTDGFKMFYDGWMQMVKTDDIGKEGLEWAAKRQYLDPTIKNLLGKKLSESPTGYEGFREAMSWPAAVLEHHLVRTPTFFMFEKALRDSIPDKEARFEEAAQKTDYYMVNYNRVHAPAVYDNLGIAGEMLRPLKMYSHNYIGQFLEYLQHAKDAKEYAPLATFFGTQAAVAGLKGMMFVAEASIAVNLINYLTDSNIPTPEQLLMKSGLHDALIFGGLSSVLGRDVSSSVAAPGLPSMLNFPAVELTVDMIKDVGNYAVQYLKGQETDYDRLRAWLAITPSAMHEWLKNIYTPEGMPTANQYDPQQRGNFRRDDFERLVSSATGTKSLDEAKADMLIRNVKKELVRDLNRKLDSIDAITDRVQNGTKIDLALFQKYIANGGDPGRLSQNVADRMKNRQLTGVERQQDHQITPQQAHKIQLLQQYLDANTPDPLKYGPMGFDPHTGEVKPMAQNETHDQDGKRYRLYNDTEGNPDGGRYVENLENRMKQGPTMYGPIPFQDNDIPGRRGKELELNSGKRRRMLENRKVPI